MFNSGVLDVAIGLIFIYLVLSLVCSSISEIIEAKLKIRAVGLERGIRELLGNKDDVRMVKEFQTVTAERLARAIEDGDRLARRLFVKGFLMRNP